MNNINPFNLLGVAIESSHKEVRRAYYKLSLLCHPDKGGSKDDMIMLHNAYNYVMEQIEFSEKADTLENIEEDFKNFFEKNKTEVPPFYELWKRSEEAEFLREFNKNFEENKNNEMENNLLNSNVSGVFSVGYGEFMEERKGEQKEDQKEDEDEDLMRPLNNKFEEELVVYKEPVNLPNDYGVYERFDVEKIDDYSDKTKELNMFDYKKAHSERRDQEINKEKTECDVNEAYEKLIKERKFI
jgi:curved DNA-binding protein CbpA